MEPWTDRIGLTSTDAFPANTGYAKANCQAVAIRPPVFVRGTYLAQTQVVSGGVIVLASILINILDFVQPSLPVKRLRARLHAVPPISREPRFGYGCLH